jgi:ribonucleases P/MRP protein subunit RPP40
LLQYLYQHKLITRHQHGFLSRHSTCTQLLECVNDWSLALRNRHAVDIVYFDFAKAFDTVSHTKLLQKIGCYGINGPLYNILANFLSGRYQRVVLPNGSSDSKLVTSGVPQGSVLGPLLFLLYINDITDYFTNNVSVKLFADDVKIYFEIVNESDASVFQNSINHVSEWANTWQLQLALNKCQHMRIGLARSDNNIVYQLNNIDLISVAVCRDLGVEVDSHLTFNQHIDSVVSRAHLRACQILRCFASKDPEILFKAFTTYVRPLLEYCSPVWSPVTIGNINKLESVQRRFTKRLNGLAFVPYDERLLLLNTERLETRRLRTDLTTCYKIITGAVDMTANEFFEFNRNACTRGHQLKLFVPDSRVNARSHFFCVKVIHSWNNLPENVVCASNINLFTNLLKSVDFKNCILGKP